MKRHALPALSILAAAALVGLLVYGLASRGGRTTLDQAVAGGKRVAAPDRRLPVLGAPGMRSLASLRGKVVVLNFWASWCDPCKAEAPALERLQKTIGTRGATVLGVSSNDVTSKAGAFVRRYGLTYPSIRDVDGELARAYGSTGLPETFVIDRRGRVAAVRRGQVDEPYLRRAVMPLLSEPA